ncbi:hypothetical protein NIES4106_58040 (plasmid) [Fischerella sp. NIES-4106]|nr:hypothetical protein NIES4106_58040 [Fischerella sp. NIES-4106]
MNMVSQIATQGLLFDLQTILDYGQSIVNVAQELAKLLIEHRPLTTKIIFKQMNRFFLGTAAQGAWQWKDAYEAVEVALILYLRHKGLSDKPLEDLQLIESLCPTHTRRSQEQIQLQQFSTPLALAYLVSVAGQITTNDLILEPSAGTGILVQFAKLKGASLMLNELAPNRTNILRCLFPAVPLFSVNAEQINDYLACNTQPSVVLMNPPFSASPKINSRNPDATARHVNSALQRLCNGGRLVTITANWFSPSNPTWQDTFTKMQQKATVVLSVGVNGRVYSKHGTHIHTRITVIDKVPATNPNDVSCIRHTVELAELATLIEQLPSRPLWERPHLVAQTGAGKGRQIAGILLDNWCQGRRKAIWVSKSSALIEDARRDWCALGGNQKHIIDLSNIKLGNPIPFSEGILFITYSTLRSQKGGKSRLKQIIDWAGKDFEGVIAFDECHAMGNAMAQEGTLGLVKASQQGIVGLRLQNALPLARVTYISATGATKVSNLSYANRLGLWQTGDFPFTSREDFVESISVGGIAAMEVVARDLKALGLYLARSLSFEGVEYDTLEIDLTSTQQRIYDSYADAFEVIHNNLHQALQACNICGGKTYNRAAKMSAMSQFESHKQRFFNHLLTGMKCPQLIKAIEQDLAQGNAIIIQIVSTNEELLKRRLNDIPAEEWKDLNLDLTPREYVLDYLMSAFPVHLHEIHSAEDGEERSEPVFNPDGSPILSQEALALRDALVDKLAILDSIPGALEQLLWHFGHSQVAEVTGRSKRVLLDEAGQLGLIDKIWL